MSLGRALGSLILGAPGSPAHDLHGPHVAAEVVSSLLQAKFPSFKQNECIKKTSDLRFHRCLLQKKEGRRQTVDNP